MRSSIQPTHNEIAAVFVGEDGAPPANRDIVGTLSGTDAFIHLPLPLNATLNGDWSINSEKLHFSLPSHSSRDVLTEDEQEQLKNLYSQLYNLPVSEILVNRAFMQYKEISLNSKQLGAFNSRSKHSSVVCNWNIDSSAEDFCVRS